MAGLSVSRLNVSPFHLLTRLARYLIPIIILGFKEHNRLTLPVRTMIQFVTWQLLNQEAFTTMDKIYYR